MPAITPIVALISQDVTTKLITAGSVYATATVTGATASTPIVITTSSPHLLVGNFVSCVVSGIGGIISANGTFNAQVVDATHLALYSYSSSGVLSPVVGTGSYTSGGTVQTALCDGGIVIGRVHVEENFGTPRVIMIPKSSRFAPRSTPNRQSTSTNNALAQGASVRSFNVLAQGTSYSVGDTVTIGAPDISTGTQATALVVLSPGGNIIKVLPTNVSSGYLKPPTVTITSATGTGVSITANLAQGLESLAQMASRGIWTDFVTFEVQVWQASATPNYEFDFDATQTLYQQVMASAWLLAPGQVTLSSGRWLSSQPGETQMDLRGQVFCFDLEIATPIADQPLQYANPQVRPSLTNKMIAIDTATVETGWSGTG